MPALLPDGTPSDLSVSPVIARRELAQGETPHPPPATGVEPDQSEASSCEIEASSREEARP